MLCTAGIDSIGVMNTGLRKEIDSLGVLMMEVESLSNTLVLNLPQALKWVYLVTVTLQCMIHITVS